MVSEDPRGGALVLVALNQGGATDIQLSDHPEWSGITWESAQGLSGGASLSGDRAPLISFIDGGYGVFIGRR